MAKTMNKEAFAEAISTHEVFENYPKYKIKQFVEDFFGIVTDAVVAGDSVSIAGFGKFENFERQNGTRKPKFTAFKDFKEAVNK